MLAPWVIHSLAGEPVNGLEFVRFEDSPSLRNLVSKYLYTLDWQSAIDDSFDCRDAAGSFLIIGIVGAEEAENRALAY